MLGVLDFCLGLFLGAMVTALASAALFSYREFKRETTAEIEKLGKRLEETQAMTMQTERERQEHGNHYEN